LLRDAYEERQKITAKLAKKDRKGRKENLFVWGKNFFAPFAVKGFS
jgi:hypothetical protein